MGSFWAHLQAGVFLTSLAFLWAYNAFREHIRCVCQGKEFIPHCYFQSRLSCSKFSKCPPLEIIFRTTLALIGFLGEFFDEGFGFTDENGDFRKTLNMTHCVIYGNFVIQGIVDLMTWYKWPVPKDLNYFLLGFSFMWFAVGFYLHELHAEDKMPLEKICHQLQIISLSTTGVAVWLEMCFRRGFMTVFVRTLGTMVIGTWFIQMAFTLFIHDGRYPGTEPAPGWNQRDMRNVHFAMAAYGAHIAMDTVILITGYLGAACLYRRCQGLAPTDPESNGKTRYREVNGNKYEYGGDEDLGLVLLNGDEED